jgi:hypothetical protein
MGTPGWQEGGEAERKTFSMDASENLSSRIFTSP